MISNMVFDYASEDACLDVQESREVVSLFSLLYLKPLCLYHHR